MTDADTLLTAYFCAEYQIPRCQAYVLNTLYQAHRPMNRIELAERSNVATISVGTYIHYLRQALGEESFSPSIANCRACRTALSLIGYSLTPYGRAEIDTALSSALAELSARIAPKRLAIAA